MTRQVTHAEKTKNLCECGAKFHTPRDLRRHLSKQNDSTRRSKRTH